MQKQLFTYLTDIRFWIVLTFVIKMVGITDPPIEIGHNWRQTTVTMVARNFLEVDNNILYPRIDIAGEKSGITGMEFPIFNYLIYMVSFVFGYEHWFGRLINLIISSLGAWYFFKLVLKYFNTKIAFNATFILLFSIWFSYSRKIMPDTFAVSLVLIGMYFSSNYLDKKNLAHLFLGTFLIGLGVLSKLPAGVVLTPFILYLFSKKYKISTQLILSITLIISLIPCLVWYFYWVPYLNSEFGFWHFFMGKSFLIGYQEFLAEPPVFLEKIYGTTLFYIGFTVFLVGIFFGIKKNNKLLLWITGISFISIVVILLKSGQTFAHHTYYMIPFIPAMALTAGFGISKIPVKSIAILFLIGISTEGIMNQYVDFRIPQQHKNLLCLEQDLSEFSLPSDRILINSDNVPTPMYLAQKKGWLANNELIQNETFIDSLSMKGLSIIVVLKQAFGTDVSLPYVKLKETENYTFYSIEPIQP